MEILALVVFTLLLLIGTAGVILPVVPGVPLIALGGLIAAWLTDFSNLTLNHVAILVGLAILSQILEYASTVVGARYYGARRAGVWGSIIGSLAGLIWFPPFGFLAGAIIGAIVAEMIAGRAFGEAVRAGFGALIGTLGGIFAKVLIIIAMAILALPPLVIPLLGA